MQLTILGSGTCAPRINRASAGILVQTNKTKILFDCGTGTLNNLVQSGVDYKKIDLIFLSHLHTDHVANLFPLLHALNWTPDLKNKNHFFNRKGDLTIMGAPGFKKWFLDMQNLLPGTKPRPKTYKIKIKESIKNSNFKEFKIETSKGNHSPFSLLSKFTTTNKKIFYSGDTDWDDNIINLGKNADLLILECSWPDKYKESGHLTPIECGKIAYAAKAKKLLLTHFYPPTEKIDIKKIVSKYYNGPVIIAKDLMKINI